MNKTYLKTNLFLLFLSASSALFSQNVAINSTGAAADPSAGLDVNFTNKGMLIPRVALTSLTDVTTIPSPAQFMMVFNSNTGCLEYFNGTAWQNIFCPCSGTPATPGSISGSASFCSGASGVTYSIAAVTGTNYYTWSVPPGITITAGQGTTGITITVLSSVSGNISVTATNSCGTSAASYLSITANTPPAITGQPVSPATVCSGAGAASFTVTATGTGLTYQWQEYISSWNNLSNGGVYSGVTTPALTITNPSFGMNGNKYQCIVNGTCTPSVTSNGLATLTVSTPYVPITITNSQGSPTGNNFQQMLTVNSSNYTAYENITLQNIEFTTGPGATGNVLQAWIESGNSNGASGTIYWVNLGSNTITANGGTLTIYMNFMGTNVMSASGPTGEAPQLSGSYGQYDNGANVFINYWNFSGSSLPGGWTTYGTAPSVSNKLSFPGSGGGLAETTTASYSIGNILDYLTINTSSGNAGGAYVVDPSGGPYTQAGWFAHTNSSGYIYSGLVVQAASSGSAGFFTYYHASSDNQYFTPSVVNNAVVSQASTGSTAYGYYNYTMGSTSNSGTIAPSGNYYIVLGENGGSGFSVQWVRTRSLPPAGVMPGSSAGSETCQ